MDNLRELILIRGVSGSGKTQFAKLIAHLALNSSKVLNRIGIRPRVVSMPSWELFEEQSLNYQQHIFPSTIPKIAIEAGVSFGWSKYVGKTGGIEGRPG